MPESKSTNDDSRDTTDEYLTDATVENARMLAERVEQLVNKTERLDDPGAFQVVLNQLKSNE